MLNYCGTRFRAQRRFLIQRPNLYLGDSGSYTTCHRKSDFNSQTRLKTTTLQSHFFFSKRAFQSSEPQEFSSRAQVVAGSSFPLVAMADHAANGKIILDEVEDTLRKLLTDVGEFIEKNPLSAEAETSKVLLPDELKKAPLELRFAGGWVRDKLLGVKSHDIDVAINKMTGEQFGDRLQEYLDAPGNAEKYGLGGLKKKAGSLTKIEKNPEASKNLETVTTKILGLDIDLVNLRKETYTETSRNPLVEFGTPEEDALRRDATINALFYNITTGELEDFTGSGLKDMKEHIIRTPIDPYITFKDDPLRVLRLIRFASRLDWQIDAETKKAMQDEEVRKFFLAKITKERVWVECEKMLKGPDPHYALSLFHELDLYRTVFIDPAQPKIFEPETDSWPLVYDAWEDLANTKGNDSERLFDILVTSQDERFLSWFLASMIPWADAPEVEPLKTGKVPPPLATQAALGAFKPPNQVTTVLTAAVRNLNEIRGLKDHQEKARETLGMAIRSWGASWRSQVIFAMLYEIFLADKSKVQSIINGYSAFVLHIKSLGLLEVHTFKPLIDGTSLAKALGTRPGPWMKAALDVVMAWQLRNPDITDPAAAIEDVKASDVLERKEGVQNGHVKKKQKKGELTSALISHFVREALRPLFSKGKPNPELTAAGRRKMGTRDRGRVFESGDEGRTHPWKMETNRWALDLLLWVCRAVEGKDLEKEWGFIIPPLLAVLDDTEPKFRAKGCELLTAMLAGCPPALLKRTGLGPLFEESLFASTTYLPSLTPEEDSIAILNAALPSLLALTNITYPASTEGPPDDNRVKAQDNILRKAYLATYSHAGEHIHITEILLRHVPSLLHAMGITSVKHLKDTVPLLSKILTDPLGPAYPPLLIKAAKALQAVVLNGWPRIMGWKGEVLRGCTVCWIRIEEEGGDIDGRVLEELRRKLKTVVGMLMVVVRSQEEEGMGERDVERLVGADERLGELFSWSSA